MILFALLLNQRGLNAKRPTIVFFLGPTKPLQSYGQASQHRRYSIQIFILEVKKV
jgi:hypothetical protein